MAKDTEKLIRQLSLISFLLAERRPVTAQQIRSCVEGYATMNEEAFARRFYADRMELEALGIAIELRRPSDAANEQETYALREERLHLQPVSFSDEELVALQMALKLLDGRFAYAEPLRLALQQITWGHPNPLQPADHEPPVVLGATASAGSADHAQRLAKIEAGIVRRKTVVFDYYTLARDELSRRKVDPYFLLYQQGEFYLIGYSHERADVRVFRLSRIRGRVSFASKSEHDFRPPAEFDPRAYVNRAEWQFGPQRGVAELEIDERLGWYVQRHFGRFGETVEQTGGGLLFRTPYADGRALIAWLLSLRGHARLLGPAELLEELEQRIELLERRQQADLPLAKPQAAQPKERPEPPAADEPDQAEAAIKPERLARLAALASTLIAAGRRHQQLQLAELAQRFRVSIAELRDDISVLNVVNFGGGRYVLYAEVDEREGVVSVDPEPYADTFERPVRLLPIEAKALLSAIDLLGSHLGGGALESAREKVVRALGHDSPGLLVEQRGDDQALASKLAEAIEARQLVQVEYLKLDEDDLVQREVEPLALARGREGWYLTAFDRSRMAVRHFRLDRIKQVSLTGRRFKDRPGVDPEHQPRWLATGELEGARTAVVWVAPERSRWARERYRPLAELADGSVLVAVPYGSLAWLVGAVLREAGDAAVVEPKQGRTEVLRALRRLRKTAVAA